MKKSYEEVEELTKKDLEKGVQNHMLRCQKMREDFLKAAKGFARDLGCDVECLEECHDPHVDHCFRQCKCGHNIVEVKPVNTAGIVEAVYGDVENLTDEQLKEIDWSLNLMKEE